MAAAAAAGFVGGRRRKQPGTAWACYVAPGGEVIIMCTTLGISLVILCIKYTGARENDFTAGAHRGLVRLEGKAGAADGGWRPRPAAHRPRSFGCWCRSEAKDHDALAHRSRSPAPAGARSSSQTSRREAAAASCCLRGCQARDCTAGGPVGIVASTRAARQSSIYTHDGYQLRAAF